MLLPVQPSVSVVIGSHYVCVATGGRAAFGRACSRVHMHVSAHTNSDEQTVWITFNYLRSMSAEEQYRMPLLVVMDDFRAAGGWHTGAGVDPQPVEKCTYTGPRGLCSQCHASLPVPSTLPTFPVYPCTLYSFPFDMYPEGTCEHPLEHPCEHTCGHLCEQLPGTRDT